MYLRTFIGGAVYFLMMLARAMFHEATVLYNRRHALRFGRLFVYSQGGHLSPQGMEEAFKWNVDSPSAFKDIRGEKRSKTPLQGVLDLSGKLTETLKEAVDLLAELRKKSPNA